MIEVAQLENLLCRTFCSSVSVHPVPAGYAISTLFTDRSGDRISFYVTEGPDGLVVSDDGEFLPRLIASGIQIDQGTRGNLLEAILTESNSYWDRETYEISTNPIGSERLADTSIAFLSSLIRIRDLEILTRDVIKSTFKDDVIDAINQSYAPNIEVSEESIIDRNLSEFPADIILRPRNVGRSAAVYLATSNEKLAEALLLLYEAEQQDRQDFKVVALIEDSNLRGISRSKFQRAQNRALAMPIFRGDEDAALKRIAREMMIAA